MFTVQPPGGRGVHAAVSSSGGKGRRDMREKRRKRGKEEGKKREGRGRGRRQGDTSMQG